MIYKYIAPSPVLQEFVRDYLIAHFIFDKEQHIPFKPYSPKPEQTITFLPKGNLRITNPLNGGNAASTSNFYFWTAGVEI